MRDEPKCLGVWGRSQEDIRRHLHEILEHANACNRNNDEQFRDDQRHCEFIDMVNRLKLGHAQTVLRKFFSYNSKCNLAEEIWIQDKKNPYAESNKYKAYSILHVHYHGHHLNAKPYSSRPTNICAVNARHLSPTCTTSYQGDNPFFHTYIEKSGPKTLKLIPSAKTWLCECIPPEKDIALEKCKICDVQRPCEVWDWKVQGQQKYQHIADILEAADEASKIWNRPEGGSTSVIKDRFRGRGDTPDGYMSVQDVREMLNTPRVVGLFVGIDEYDHMAHLQKANQGATRLVECMKKISCADNDIEIIEAWPSKKLTVDSLKRQVIQLCNVFERCAQAPKILVFYFAGHGLRYDGQDFLLCSDFDASEERKCLRFDLGCLSVQQLINLVCDNLPDNAAEETEKYFILDACRTSTSVACMQSTSPVRRKSTSGSIGQSAPCLSIERNEHELCIEVPNQTLVIFSAQPGHKSSDMQPFSDVLEKNIFQPGHSFYHLMDAARREYSKACKEKKLSHASSKDEIIKRDGELAFLNCGLECMNTVEPDARMKHGKEGTMGCEDKYSSEKYDMHTADARAKSRQKLQALDDDEEDEALRHKKHQVRAY